METAMQSRGVMIGEVLGMPLYGGLTVETALDPSKQPFLYDHQISQTPVLPGVMGIEAMAETARLIFPDRNIKTIENVQFLAPFKFYRNQPRIVTIQADYSVEEEDIVANCRILGSRILHGQSEPEVTLHFSGSVRLASGLPNAVKKGTAPQAGNGAKVARSHLYRLYFHGPAYQVIDSAWRDGKQIVALFAKNLPANHVPPELPLVASPRLIEFCFQAASLSGMAVQSRLGLPYAFREIEMVSLPEKAPESALFALVDDNPDGTYNAEVVDDKGNLYLVLRGYRTMDLPDPIQADLLDPLKSALKA
jgi:hypothetical protein